MPQKTWPSRPEWLVQICLVVSLNKRIIRGWYGCSSWEGKRVVFFFIKQVCGAFFPLQYVDFFQQILLKCFLSVRLCAEQFSLHLLISAITGSESQKVKMIATSYCLQERQNFRCTYRTFASYFHDTDPILLRKKESVNCNQ